MRPVRLRTRVAWLMAALGLVTVLASVSLVLLTTLLGRATVELGDGIESVRLAETAVADLLLLERADDPVARADLEARVERNLRLAQAFVTTPEESEALDEAERAVAAYSDEDTGEDYERAFSALRELASINVDHARRVRDQAAAWDRAGTVIGTLGAVAVPAMVLLTVVSLDLWLRPVLELGRTMERHLHGERDARAPETGPTEIREMAAGFNALASTLARQHEAQLAFLGGVAHDLRNPLMALRLASAAVRRGGSAVEPRQILEVVARQVDHLDRMLTDLLDTARVHSGRFALDLAGHDLRAVAREVVELFTIGGTRQITLDLADAPVVARCDAARIGQVLTNLVSNAVKYSPEGAPVSVSVRDEHGVAAVSVTDQGIGIADTELEAIFEPFRRSDTEGPAVPGAGLGLFVARRIVEEHGGRIVVTSARGRGSTFRVELPAAGP